MVDLDSGLPSCRERIRNRGHGRILGPEGSVRAVGHGGRHGSGGGRADCVGSHRDRRRRRAVRRSRRTTRLAEPLSRGLVPCGRSGSAAGSTVRAGDGRSPAPLRRRWSRAVALRQRGPVGRCVGPGHAAGQAAARRTGLRPDRPDSVGGRPPGVCRTRLGPGHAVDVQCRVSRVCRISVGRPTGPRRDSGVQRRRTGVPVGRVPAGPRPRVAARLASESAVSPRDACVSPQLRIPGRQPAPVSGRFPGVATAAAREGRPDGRYCWRVRSARGTVARVGTGHPGPAGNVRCSISSRRRVPAAVGRAEGPARRVGSDASQSFAFAVAGVGTGGNRRPVRTLEDRRLAGQSAARLPAAAAGPAERQATGTAGQLPEQLEPAADRLRQPACRPVAGPARRPADHAVPTADQ